MSARARYRLNCIIGTVACGVAFMLAGVIPELLA